MRGLGFTVDEVLLAEMDEPFELNVAYYADDHSVGGIVCGHEVLEHGRGEVADVFLIA